MKRILILYTSIGLGHKSIAENIGYHLERAGYSVQLHDILKVQEGILVTVGSWLHRLVNTRLPFMWSWMYKSDWFTKATLWLRVPLASQNYKETKRVVDAFDPDLIITTQTSASAVIAYLKRKAYYKNLFAIAFSDFHLHPYWLYNEADFYLANIVEQKKDMVALGVSANRIFVCGITLKPKLVIDTLAVKEQLGISVHEKVVLIASGSLGIGLTSAFYSQLVAKIIKQAEHGHMDFKIIIVCGKNQDLYNSLKTSIRSERVIVQGYYSPMAELYSIASVFVTKPGGLSVAESLQWDLPVIVTHALPGQEELNIGYLTRKNLIRLVGEPGAIAQSVMDDVVGGYETSFITNAAASELVHQNHEGRGAIEAVNAMFHGSIL